MNATLIVAGVPAILYVMSNIHYNAMIGAARLAPFMMERSFHQVIYHGMLVSFMPVFYTLTAIWLLLFLVQQWLSIGSIGRL